MTAGATPAPGAAGGAFETCYDTTVVAVGDMVAEFRAEGVIILFGEQAPEELWEFSVRHRPAASGSGPRVGDLLEIDGSRFPVLAVGSVVEDNLLQLGHLDIKADGRAEPALPGDLCLPRIDLPMPAVGGSIRLLRPPRESHHRPTSAERSGR